MINDDLVLVDGDGKKYKILCTRGRWIDLYELETGEIITKCGKTLTEDLKVFRPDIVPIPDDGDP